MRVYSCLGLLLNLGFCLLLSILVQLVIFDALDARLKCVMLTLHIFALYNLRPLHVFSFCLEYISFAILGI